MKKLAVYDIQDITRLGIVALAKDLHSFESITEIRDKSDLLNFISENTNCIVILDYALSEFSSIRELQILHERYANVDWLLFSDEINDSFLREMKANSLMFSIVLKTNNLEEIRDCIVSTQLGDQYLCKRIYNHILTLSRITNDSDDNPLTTTEKEILKEIALGKTTKEIAADRNLSFHTIMTHRKNIFRKLEVNNVHEATKFAMKAGIVDVSEYYI